MTVSESSGIFLLLVLLVGAPVLITGSRAKVAGGEGTSLKREGCVRRLLPLLFMFRVDEKKGRASSSMKLESPEFSGRRRREGEKERGEETKGGGRGDKGEDMERWLKTSVSPGMSVK